MPRSPRRRATFILPPLLLAGGCVPAPEAAPVPPPAAIPPVAVPAAPRAADWQDWPLTPGDWSYGRGDRDTKAVFSTPRGPAQTRLVRLTCLPAARQVAITGVAGSGPLTIRTSSATRALADDPAGEGSSLARSVLAATDPLLDAIAFSRGRFVLQRAGAGPLVLPAYPEIGRVIEDCRG